MFGGRKRCEGPRLARAQHRDHGARFRRLDQVMVDAGFAGTLAIALAWLPVRRARPTIAHAQWIRTKDMTAAAFFRPRRRAVATTMGGVS